MSRQNLDLGPNSRDYTIDAIALVKAMGALILAAGIIGVMVWQFGAAEFLNLVLFVCLPVLAFLAAIGLVKYATVTTVWNFEMKQRVLDYVDAMKEEARRAEERPASGATA